MTNPIPQEIQEAMKVLAYQFKCDGIHEETLIEQIKKYLGQYLHLPQSDGDQVNKIEKMDIEKLSEFVYGEYKSINIPNAIIKLAETINFLIDKQNK